jgi:hypothetical protein
MAEPTPVESPATPTTPGVRHERTDANVLGIALAGAMMTVLGVIACAIVWGVFDYFERRENAGKKGSAPLAVRESQRSLDQRLHAIRSPRLEGLRRLESPGGEHATESVDSRLRSYGWVDQAQGIAHIPIDRAMAAIASGGLLPAKAKPPPPSGIQAMPSAANSGRGTRGRQP